MTEQEAIKTIRECIGSLCNCPVQEYEVDERCGDCGFYQALMKAIGALENQAYIPLDTPDIKAYDKDHVWYKGRQFVSLRRFLEVKRNHGEIIEHINKGKITYTCSECGEKIEQIKRNYCGNCGAELHKEAK